MITNKFTFNPKINLLFKVLAVAFPLFTSLSCREDIDEHNKVIIAKFPYDKDCAISFTFDDNCASCATRIAPLFNEFNYKATFFVISNQIKNWEPWKKLHDDGFEIGNHSADHLNLSKVYDSAILNQQINASYDLIATEIGEPPASFAHPGHGTNPRVDSIVFQKHLFSRMSPRGFCRWDGWTAKTTETRIKKEILSAINNNLWYVPAAHGIGDCYEPIQEYFLENILLFIKGYEDRILVEPFKNVALYKEERKHSRILVNDRPNKKIITLQTNLPDDLYNYPLTLLIKNYNFHGDFLITSPNSSLIKIINNKNDLQLIVKPNAIIEIQWF